MEQTGPTCGRSSAGTPRAHDVGAVPGRHRVGGREHRRRGGGSGAVGRRRRRAGHARVPGREHARRHGGAHTPATSGSAGRAPTPTTSRTGSPPGPPRCWSRRPVRPAPRRWPGSCGGPAPTRRRTGVWPRPPSPRRSASGSGAPTATAIGSSPAGSWVMAAHPNPTTCNGRSPSSATSRWRSPPPSPALAPPRRPGMRRGGVGRREGPAAVHARRRRRPRGPGARLDPDDLLDLAMTMNPVAPDPRWWSDAASGACAATPTPGRRPRPRGSRGVRPRSPAAHQRRRRGDRPGHRPGRRCPGRRAGVLPVPPAPGPGGVPALPIPVDPGPTPPASWPGPTRSPR